MSLLRKKSWWQLIAAAPLSTIILFILSITIAFAVYDRYKVEREMSERRDGSEAELRALEKRRDELAAKVERLDSEEGIEAEIRRNFDVAREGEKVIILVEEENSTVEPISNDFAAKSRSVWRSFLEFIIPW